MLLLLLYIAIKNAKREDACPHEAVSAIHPWKQKLGSILGTTLLLPLPKAKPSPRTLDFNSYRAQLCPPLSISTPATQSQLEPVSTLHCWMTTAGKWEMVPHTPCPQTPNNPFFIVKPEDRLGKWDVWCLNTLPLCRSYHSSENAEHRSGQTSGSPAAPVYLLLFVFLTWGCSLPGPLAG